MSASKTGPRNHSTGWTEGPNGGKMHSHQEAPAMVLERPTPTEVHVSEVCKEAGFAGIMPGVFGVLLDRESDGAVLGLPHLDWCEVEELHDEYVGPAVDETEKWISRFSNSEPATADEVNEHIQKMCFGAGYEGVMPGFLQSVVDRHEGDDEILARMKGMDSGDIHTIYEEIVGPAIDELEARVAETHCVSCGESTKDDTISWKFCPSCGSDDNEIISSR